jgi:hypothetical protein
MTKDELLKQYHNMVERAERLETSDREKREALSKCLGSYEKENYNPYRAGIREVDLKTLNWSEIYFEIGKLKAEIKYFQDLEEIKKQIEHINNQMELERIADEKTR